MSEDKIYNASIIIVDDDDDLRETLVDVLAFEGFNNTIQAEDGIKAIEMIRDKKIDLVICDLQMPEMDGIETIKHMINKYNPSKVYLIIGADNYKSFHLWERHEEIAKLVTLVVVARDGFKYEHHNDVKQLKVDINISSTEFRNTFNLKFIPKKIRKDVENIWHKKGKT